MSCTSIRIPKVVTLNLLTPLMDWLIHDGRGKLIKEDTLGLSDFVDEK